MAGSYSDVPAPRIAYDRDGTLLVRRNRGSGVVTTDTAADMRTINNESGDEFTWLCGLSNVWDVCLYFTAPRDLHSMFASHRPNDSPGESPHVTDWQWSPDSTEPSSGTWTSFTYTQNAAEVVVPNYRTDITALGLTGVKAIRMVVTAPDAFINRPFRIAAWHLFGPPISTLKLWHPTSNVVLSGAHFDFGDIAAGGSYSRQFRVKNTHATRTAHAVVVTREALTDKTPSMVGATHLFSIDGGPYATSCAVGDLAPGAISDVITVQRDLPVDAQSSLGAGRYVAQAGSWS